MGLRETQFRSKFLKKLKRALPECFVIINDPTYIQGIPDVLVLNYDRWAMLEFKRHSNADRRPNQDYYVRLFDEMSYSSFVYPENEEIVLDEIQLALSPRR